MEMPTLFKKTIQYNIYSFIYNKTTKQMREKTIYEKQLITSSRNSNPSSA